MPFGGVGRATAPAEIVSPLAEEDEESDIEPSAWADSRLIVAIKGGAAPEEVEPTDECGGADAASAPTP